MGITKLYKGKKGKLKMKILSLMIIVIIATLSTFLICKPKSIKQKLYGYWMSTVLDAEYGSKIFLLVFYENDTFYWYFKGRVPKSAANGTFTLIDTTKISFQFSDTNQESVFIIKKFKSKILEVDYNGRIIIFRRSTAFKKPPI